MAPNLSGGIDHIHVYVPSRKQAADWYAKYLGFEVDKELEFWSRDEGGPLTIVRGTSDIHLALFKSDSPQPYSLAFGASAQEYLEWRQFLDARGIEFRESDHTRCWSIYFGDPFGNFIEVTSWEHQAITEANATD